MTICLSSAAALRGVQIYRRYQVDGDIFNISEESQLEQLIMEIKQR